MWVTDRHFQVTKVWKKWCKIIWRHRTATLVSTGTQIGRQVYPVHCKGGQLCRKIVWFVVIIVYSEEHLSFGCWIKLIVLSLLNLKCLQLKLKYSLVRHICTSAKSTCYLCHIHLTACVSVAPIGQIAMEFDTASVAPDTNYRNLRAIHHTFLWNMNFIDKTPIYQLITTCGLIWKCFKIIQVWLKLGKISDTWNEELRTFYCCWQY